MSHVHLYPHDQRFGQIPFNLLHQILRSAIGGNKAGVLARIRSLDADINQPLDNQALDPNIFQRIDQDFIRDLETWVAGASVEEETLIEASRRNVHHIAQPVTASVASGLTNDIIMAMPPWSQRLPRTTPQSELILQGYL